MFVYFSFHPLGDHNHRLVIGVVMRLTHLQEHIFWRLATAIQWHINPISSSVCTYPWNFNVQSCNFPIVLIYLSDTPVISSLDGRYDRGKIQPEFFTGLKFVPHNNVFRTIF